MKLGGGNVLVSLISNFCQILHVSYRSTKFDMLGTDRLWYLTFLTGSTFSISFMMLIIAFLAGMPCAHNVQLWALCQTSWANHHYQFSVSVTDEAVCVINYQFFKLKKGKAMKQLQSFLGKFGTPLNILKLIVRHCPCLIK